MTVQLLSQVNAHLWSRQDKDVPIGDSEGSSRHTGRGVEGTFNFVELGVEGSGGTDLVEPFSDRQAHEYGQAHFEVPVYFRLLLLGTLAFSLAELGNHHHEGEQQARLVHNLIVQAGIGFLPLLPQQCQSLINLLFKLLEVLLLKHIASLFLVVYDFNNFSDTGVLLLLVRLSPA